MPIRNLFSFFSSKRKSKRELLSNDIEHLKVTLSDERSAWEHERAQLHQQIENQDKKIVKYLAVIEEQQDHEVKLRKTIDNVHARTYWLVKTVGSFKKNGDWSIPICHNCSIQYSGRSDPKVLMCGHTICYGCAKRLRNTFVQPKYLNCPFCQERTDLEMNSVQMGLPTNTAVVGEIERLKKIAEGKLIDIN